MPLIKRFLLWSLAVLVVLLILAAVGFRCWFQSFLQSDRCRQWVTQAASSALHAKGELMPLQATPGSLYSDGFVAQDGASFHLLQADQLRADVQFGFWARTCEIGRLDIARLRVNLGGGTGPANANGVPVAKEMETPSATPSGPWNRSRFILRQIAINDLIMGWNGGELKDTRVTALPNDQTAGEWLIHGEGGSLAFSAGSGMTASNQPDWRVENFDARFHGNTVFLTNAELKTGDHGEVRLEGELNPQSTDHARCQVTFSGIPTTSWLPVDWRARISGNLSGQLDLRVNPGSADGAMQSAEGNLALSDGQLTALPLLDQLAALTHADGFRQMRIQKASAHIVHSGTPGGSLAVTQLEAESDGLMKIQGAFTVKSGQIDGLIQLGVAPSVIQWIPGAKERVFTASRDGYLWTPVRLSGPANRPAEDLTARLATAAAVEAASNVPQSVRDNAKGVLDLVTPLIPVTIPSVQGLFP